MGEQNWTVTSDPPQPTQPPQKHTATIDGLAVEIAESPTGHCYWVVRGHLYDIEVDAHDYRPRRLSEAKAAGVRAAHRLYAAGVRGEKSFPVACCDRRFATRDAADQHEGEHAAEKGRVIVHFRLLVPDQIVCGADARRESARTMPEGVTCPACLEWLDRNALPAEPLGTEDAGAAFLLPGEKLTLAELAQLQRESEARERAASESGDEEAEA